MKVNLVVVGGLIAIAVVGTAYYGSFAGFLVACSAAPFLLPLLGMITDSSSGGFANAGDVKDKVSRISGMLKGTVYAFVKFTNPDVSFSDKQEDITGETKIKFQGKVLGKLVDLAAYGKGTSGLHGLSKKEGGGNVMHNWLVVFASGKEWTACILSKSMVVYFARFLANRVSSVDWLLIREKAMDISSTSLGSYGMKEQTRLSEILTHAQALKAASQANVAPTKGKSQSEPKDDSTRRKLNTSRKPKVSKVVQPEQVTPEQVTPEQVTL